MFVLDASRRIITWLGQQGTRAVAALVFIGIAVPSLGSVLKPFVTEAVFILLCTAFLRVDTASFAGYVRRPGIVLMATAWTSLLTPTIFGACYLVLGLKEHSPDLFLALTLQAIASPMMAAPALAALMGLDATLVLVTLVASTALVPFTASVFSYAFIGHGMMISPLALGLRLLLILGGSAVVGIIARRVVGVATIERYKDPINGFNILVLFVFVAAIMENVAANFIANPLAMVGLSSLAFTVFIALLGITFLLFTWAGRERALVLGMMASQRNLGLMLAATGGALPDMVWLYFALSQLPIYLSPQLLKPLTRRLLKPSIDSRCDLA